jgi:hypothetical protein
MLVSMSETTKSVEGQMNQGMTELKNVPLNAVFMKLQTFLLVHEVELMDLRKGLRGKRSS